MDELVESDGYRPTAGTTHYMMSAPRHVVANHDEGAFRATIRDCLSRHDRPLAFLFGAGTSCCVDRVSSNASDKLATPLIPDVRNLTIKCRKAVEDLGSDHASGWSAIVARCDSTNHEPNVEHILDMLHMMIEAIGPSDQLAGLDREALREIDLCIRKCIADVVNPELEHVPPSEIPHHKFAQWLAKTVRKLPVEIFTVNYDILFELAFEAVRLPFFDGFIGSHEPFFYPDSLLHPQWAPAAGWTRLWKIHGSVNWRRRPDKHIVRAHQPQSTGEMILPTFEKYDKSRQEPYVAYINQLDRFLGRDNALLVVNGFGFGDEHLNDVIVRRLENNPRAHVFALMFAELDQTSSRIRDYATQRGNMVIAGPDTGIIGTKHGAWLSEGTRCEMPLGNFVQLCDFLDQMTSD